jgi:hypothetical protein
MLLGALTPASVPYQAGSAAYGPKPFEMDGDARATFMAAPSGFQTSGDGRLGEAATASGSLAPALLAKRCFGISAWAGPRHLIRIPSTTGILPSSASFAHL